AALTHCTFHLDLAAMGFRQLTRDCQSQADPLCPGNLLNLPKLIKDCGVIFRRDSPTVVGDIDSHTVRTRLTRGNTPLQMDPGLVLRSASLPAINAGDDGDPPERR